MNDIRVLSLRGSYEAMGHQYGSRLPSEIRANVDDYDRCFGDQAGLRRADVARWGAIYRNAAAEYDTDIAHMLTAVAEGAQVPIESIFALNARTELLYGVGYHEEGCSSVAVLGSRTSGGETIIGQNWDWHPEQGPLSFLLSTIDDEGLGVVTLAEAGMLAKNGLNTAGLGVCANLPVTDLDRGGNGVPCRILLRGVLLSRTMSDAIKAVTNVQRVSTGNILIADEAGEAIDLELTPGPFGWTVPEDGLITHANHIESGINVHDEKAGRSALTLLRGVRVRHLLEPLLAQRDISAPDIHKALSDHFSFPDSVCRHPSPDDSPENQIASVCLLVMDLSQQTLALTPYPVCDMPTATYSVDGTRIDSLLQPTS